MKITKNEINNFRKILLEIPNKKNPLGNSYIIFPLETTEVKEENGFELVLQSTNNFGAKADPKPGLLLNPDPSYAPVCLVYFDDTYTKDFNINQYCSLMNVNLSKSATKSLNELECKLVDKSYILATFEF